MRGMPLSKLLPSQIVKEELDWFHMEAEYEMGITSSFGALAYMAQTGLMGTVGDPSDNAGDWRVAVIHGERKIRAWIGQLPRQLQGVLAAYYEARQYPPEINERFRDLTGIAVRTSAVTTGFANMSKRQRGRIESRVDWLVSVIKRGDEVTVKRVHAEATGLRAKAVTAYLEIRGDGPSVVPSKFDKDGRMYARAA